MPNINASDVSWGPVDAFSKDRSFEQKWVRPKSITKCLDNDAWIVSGEKGSGKSAIVKAICDIYNSEYLSICVVNFKNISFELLYKNILEIVETTQLDSLRMMSTVWQYAIIAEIIAQCAANDHNKYKKFADALTHLARPNQVHERLETALQEIWAKIDKFTRQREALDPEKRPANLPASGGLTAKLIAELRKFPMDDKFGSLIANFFGTLDANGHRVILLMDGFDQLRNENANPTSYNLIFSSLADAVLAINNYPNLPDGLFVKAIIPHDRYMNLSLRDSDKISAIHASITWDRDALEAFIGRRIALFSRVKSSRFPVIWRQAFPEGVMNTRVGLQEDSFEYILRHTMYRPRHLQIHLLKISKQYPGEVIESNMVAPMVAESSREIANQWIEEYALDFPNLKDLVNAFYQKPNIIGYNDLRGIVFDFRKQIGKETSGESLNEVIANLYSMGFFGVLNRYGGGLNRTKRYSPPSRSAQKHYVEFYFKEHRLGAVSRLSGDAEIAIHPIFNELLDLATDSELIVG